MNVFKIHRGIRKIGYNYGLPCWFVDCDLGVSYQPEELLKKLATTGLKEKDWIVIRNGLGEKGLGVFVDAIGYIKCKSEVEAFGRHRTPGWFNKADRWTVYWDGNETFNFGSLRRGQDMLIYQRVEDIKPNDLVEQGLLVSDQVDLAEIWKYRVRVYGREDVK
jgi:hypothetical protein